MKIAGVITLNGQRVPIELEVADDALGKPASAEPELLTDAELRARWRRSARTIKRLRDQRRIAYSQPSPRTFLYRMTDVIAYESESRRGAHRRQA